ncbi:MAG: PIN domain-containing protein [bacterium]
MEILYIDDKIIDNAVDYKKHYKFKVPDAIIAATAKTLDLSLVTADKALQKITDIEIIEPI